MGRSSVRHYTMLFAGWFTTILFGAALIATCLMTIWATVGVGEAVGRPARVTDTSTGATHVYYQGTSDLGGLISILLFAVVVSGFLSIMVAAGTFSFAVALRGRDLALLRLLGADGSHLRRLVRTEALLVGVPAAVGGCLLAAAITPAIVDALNITPLGAGDLRPGVSPWWPSLITLAVVVPIALVASRSAATRAAAVRPAEAFREADIDANVMTRARRRWSWVVGIAGLGMCLSAPIFGAVAGPGAAIPLAIFGPLSLAVVAVLLAPAYLPALVRLGTRSMDSLPRRLAVASVRHARRRSAALTAPVVALLAAVGIMVCVLQTTAATTVAEQRARTTAPLVAIADRPDGLGPDALAGLREHPQVEAVSAPRPVAAVVAGAFGSAPGETDVVLADIPSLLATQRITVGGSPQTPQGEAAAVSSDFASWQGVDVGDDIQVGFFDETTHTVEVTAVLDAGPSMPPTVFVSPALAQGHDEPAQHALIALRAGADAHDIAAGFPSGVQVVPVADWIDAQQEGQSSLNLLVLIILAVPGAVFTLVAIVNTVAMGFRTRRHELTTLRLLGATRRQLRRMVVTESLITSGAGIAVATVLVGFGLTCYLASLVGPYTAVAVSVPWAAYPALALLVVMVGIGANLLALRHETTGQSRRPAGDRRGD